MTNALEGPKGRILLVDDDDELLRANERTLIRAGYVVQTASDGREAVEHLELGGFDAVRNAINAAPVKRTVNIFSTTRSVETRGTCMGETRALTRSSPDCSTQVRCNTA